MMPSPELRTSDADRRRVVDVLQRHYADGRLTTEELRERISQAMVARTYADLAVLQRDLPQLESAPQVDVATPRTAPKTTRAPRQGRQAFVAHALFYLLAIISLVIIWLLTTPGGYFWPVWPALGWGIGVAAHGIAYRVGAGDPAKVTAS